MARVLIIVAIVMLTIYSVVEVAQSQQYQVRIMPKWLWAFVVICVPVAGPLAWVFFGRPIAGSGVHHQPTTRGPDDDEDFLRGLR